METQTEVAKKNTPKDVHTLITEKIIEQLEKDIVPWRASWMEAGVPTSLISKRPFRGINVPLLAALGYERNLFLTGKQLEKIGGSVIKDEKPHMIVFWNIPQQKHAAGDGRLDEKKNGTLKYYLVYNVAQCCGIPTDVIPEKLTPESAQPLCEKIVAEVTNGPSIRHKDANAYYDPLTDCINMPKLKSFEAPASYYSLLFHQLAHSTGHHTRLDRMGLVQMSEYGCSRFTQEEIVTEITTNFIENAAGIPCPFVPSQEYIDGWVRKLKSDRHLIFTACTLAQKAIDFILNVQDVKDEE